MPIYESDGTTINLVNQVYESDGTTTNLITKAFDDDGTAIHLVHLPQRNFYANGGAENTLELAKTVYHPESLAASAPHGHADTIKYTGTQISLNGFNAEACKALIGPAFEPEGYNRFRVEFLNRYPASFCPNIRFMAGLTNEAGTSLLTYYRHWGLEGEKTFAIEIHTTGIAQPVRPYIGVHVKYYNGAATLSGANLTAAYIFRRLE